MVPMLMWQWDALKPVLWRLQVEFIAGDMVPNFLQSLVVPSPIFGLHMKEIITNVPAPWIAQVCLLAGAHIVT